MQFIDKASISGVKRRGDGSLLCDARVARTGVQLYAGYEVGKPEMAVVRVYRPGSEVFSDETAASFAHRPVTNDHPAEAVDANNWKAHAVGQTAGDIAVETRYLRVPLMVSDAAAIADVEAGKRELSAGYTCDLKWGEGQTEQGETYDAVQTNIRANHVAIVAAGRAGQECRIGDSADKSGTHRTSWGAAPITISDKKKDIIMSELTTVVLGDKAVQVSITDANEVERFKADQATALKTAQEAHDKALADKDAELAKKDALIDDLKGKIIDDAALDAKVQSRAKLVADAKAIDENVKTDGLSDAQIRKAVVTSIRGEDTVKDKSDAYIDAAFDLLVEQTANDGKGDAFVDASKSTTRKGVNDAMAAKDAAYNEYVASLNNGTYHTGGQS